MSYVKTKSFFKYLAINNSEKYLLINNAEIFNEIADIGEREYLLLTIPKRPLNNGNFSPISLDEIKEFIQTDNSIITIKAISNNAITGMNNIVSGNELIINTYEGYDIDEAIDERGDCYKLYLFKRTKAFLEEVNNKKQIKCLFEDIINQYEIKLNQEKGVI